jgi:hypothetical protein
MLEFFKRVFGSKPADTTPAPYKVEVAKPAEFPFPSTKPAQNKKTVAKKTVTKKPAGPKKPAVKKSKPQ